MNKVQIGSLQFWQFVQLGKEPALNHFVTDRHSSAGKQEFTLSYSSTPDHALVRGNRAAVAESMGIREEQLFFPSQVHQTRIVKVTSSTQPTDLLETDALITDGSQICIAVMSADCVPILLYDKKNSAVGAVHSGWRGTVARILEKTLLQMQSAYGTQGEDILAGIGPSVSQDSYEVGEEVVQAVINTFGSRSDVLTPQPNHKAKLDLWKANEIQLLDFGVKKSNIEVANLCSVKNNVDFFSARKGDKGRYGAGIMLTA